VSALQKQTLLQAQYNEQATQEALQFLFPGTITAIKSGTTRMLCFGKKTGKEENT
jgi:N-methylhydantoinase B/oxoprolinase/acetone carboxylase alpha subunit